MKRGLICVVLAAVYLLRIDLWWWTDLSLVFGLPIGLAYHLVFCFVVSLVMVWLVRTAWPAGLDDDPAGLDDDNGPRAGT